MRENIPDVPEIDAEGGEYFEYDEYRLTVPDRPGLAESVAADEATWLTAAKEAERKDLAAAARSHREKLLAETDYLMAADYPISEEHRAAVAEYRQALRDITAQEGFPWSFSWPQKPGTTVAGDTLIGIVEETAAAVNVLIGGDE
jgi:hypothetical protein